MSTIKRRHFLAGVSGGALLATLGPTAFDLGLVPQSFAASLDGELTFGDLEPLVCQLQETPIEKLHQTIIAKIDQGISLKTLTGAAALANARTFGGEDYVGFHTFMALAPALKMSNLLAGRGAALPVLKVLYRNSSRIQEFGGRSAEVLHGLVDSNQHGKVAADELRQAVVLRDVRQSEQILSRISSANTLDALSALIPLVQDNPEVHRAVLPFRAWDMQEIVGSTHALTLLRQSLRYCLQSEVYRRDNWTEHGEMITKLFDRHQLHEAVIVNKSADDHYVRELSRQFAEASAADCAGLAAQSLAEGFGADVIGEALSLAASRLVLRDGGRQPQWETPLKAAGSVHGDSVGVHASDAANAWRNMSKVTNGKTAMSCLIIGAWQIARDRISAGHLLDQPLPTERHLGETTASDETRLLAQLDESIRFNQQAHATAIAQRYGELGLPADAIFSVLLKYAVSEDGALHGEKYFQTVSDDFHSTRPSLRWQHVAALARVTASEYGRPAQGLLEARQLLGLDS